jgi:predicted transcriptional regulator
MQQALQISQSAPLSKGKVEKNMITEPKNTKKHRDRFTVIYQLLEYLAGGERRISAICLNLNLGQSLAMKKLNFLINENLIRENLGKGQYNSDYSYKKYELTAEGADLLLEIRNIKNKLDFEKL